MNFNYRKEEIVNAIVYACRVTESGTLKFGNGGFISFIVGWGHKGNFEITNLETDMHYFSPTLDNAIKVLEKYIFPYEFRD